MRTERWTENKLIQKDICFECGSDNGIEYHHIVPYSKGGTKTIPLCITCHSKVHGKKYLQLDKLRREALEKRRKENPWKSGRKSGYKETDVQFMNKERTQKIKALLDENKTYEQIEQLTGYSKSTIMKVAKFFIDRGELNRIKRSERFVVTDEAQQIIRLIQSGITKKKTIMDLTGCSDNLQRKIKKYLNQSNNSIIQNNNNFF